MVFSALFRKLILSALLLQLAAGDVITLTDLPAYQTQRPCAKTCFIYDINPSASPGPYKIASFIGCDARPIKEDCFCRPDLQASAAGYVRGCVSSKCSGNLIDITPAVAIYQDFCTSLGYHAVEGAASTTGLRSSTTSTRNTASTPVQTQPPGSSGSSNTSNTSPIGADSPIDTGSSTGNQNASSKGSNGLETKDIIGIVIGAVGVIITAIGAYYSYQALKRRHW